MLFQQLSQGARLSGPMLTIKASVSALSPSYSWKSRHNIIFKKEHGEKQATDLQAALDWKADILPAVDNIFNADETGLCYLGYPDRGHCLRGDELSSGKKAKD